jgi:predicted enzyme involved in methoxymalonyl-ACP biosynthesis
MNHLVEMAARNGYRSITAEYRPSAKNSMVANFYAEFGFEKTDEKDAGVTQWRLDVPAYQPRTVYMRTAELAYAETGKS